MSESVEKKLTVYDITVQVNGFKAGDNITVRTAMLKNYLTVSADLETAKLEASQLAFTEFPGADVWVLGERREVAPDE